MTEDDFHDRLEAFVRETLASINQGDDPMGSGEWPAPVLDLVLETIQDALATEAAGCAGAPFYIEKDGAPDDGLVLNFDFMLLPFWTHCVKGQFNLAEAIMKDARSGYGAWTAQHAIAKLENTICQIKEECRSLGWPVAEQH